MTTLAFYQGEGTWRDGVIRTVTGSRYSHVEVVGPDGRCISASKRDGNQVRIADISFKTGHWTFLTTPQNPHVAWQRAVLMLGMPYDTFGAVVSGGFGVRIQSNNAWYCNEFAAYVIGLPRPWPLHPGALYEVLAHAVTTDYG